METIIKLFTVTPFDSLAYILIFGVVFVVFGWLSEVNQVYKRIRYLSSPATRDLVTWMTWVWMPVRLLVIIILPQVLFQFLTEVLKLG